MFGKHYDSKKLSNLIKQQIKSYLVNNLYGIVDDIILYRQSGFVVYHFCKFKFYSMPQAPLILRNMVWKLFSFKYGARMTRQNKSIIWKD